MVFGRLIHSLCVWWAGQTSRVRYGVALAFLAYAAGWLLVFDEFSLMGWTIGVVMLCAAVLIRD